MLPVEEGCAEVSVSPEGTVSVRREANMPTVEESALRKQMAAGELSGLFVVAGEEKYMVGRLSKQLIKKAAGGTFPEFNNQAFTNESSLEAIGDASQALPFFAERKCVSVSDFDVESKSADELNKLYELWELCPETTALVFWYPTLDFDGKRSSKWKKFLKQAEERGTVVLCGRRSRTELLRFLGREAEKSGCVLPRPSGERLLDYAGEDLTALKSEMDKLCAYALATGQGQPPEITREMVEDMVPKSTETTVFLLANALVAGDYEKAYGLLHVLFYQNEEPIAILGALGASYVDMYRVRAALESGHPIRTPPSTGTIRAGISACAMPRRMSAASPRRAAPKPASAAGGRPGPEGLPAGGPHHPG